MLRSEGSLIESVAQAATQAKWEGMGEVQGSALLQSPNPPNRP